MATNKDYRVTKKYFHTNINPQFDTYKRGYDADFNVQRNYITENIKIGGLPVNIFPLLGMHQIGTLIDLSNDGFPISGGTDPSSDPANAFTDDDSTWSSLQKGDDVAYNAWIGYYFGTIKGYVNPNASPYQSPVNITQRIQSIAIQQDGNYVNRASRIRIDASEDGNIWINLGEYLINDDTEVNIISFDNIVDYAFYRIVATAFNGKSPDDDWVIKSIRMYDQPGELLTAVQDPTLLATFNKKYCTTPLFTKCAAADQGNAFQGYIDLNIAFQNDYVLNFALNMVVEKIGRPFVVGDVLELIPNYDFDVNLNMVRKFVRVAEVSLDNDIRAVNYNPLVQTVTCKNLTASRETMDITGLRLSSDEFVESKIENNKGIITNQTGNKFNDWIKTEYNKEVPHIGTRSDEIVINQDVKNRSYGFYNALPPDGKEYYVAEIPVDGKISDHFPPNAADGDYCVIRCPEKSYEIPDQLYKYNKHNNMWESVELNTNSHVANRQMIKQIAFLESGKRVGFDDDIFE